MRTEATRPETDADLFVKLKGQAAIILRVLADDESIHGQIRCQMLELVGALNGRERRGISLVRK